MHREEGDNERGMSGESNSTKDVEKGAESERETRVRERVGGRERERESERERERKRDEEKGAAMIQNKHKGNENKGV